MGLAVLMLAGLAMVGLLQAADSIHDWWIRRRWRGRKDER